MKSFKHYKDLFISVNENRAIPVYKRHENLSEYLEGALMEVCNRRLKTWNITRPRIPKPFKII